MSLPGKETEMQEQKIIEVMEDYCKEREFDFRTDYSGRGMYGRKCVGFVVERGCNVLLAMVELTEMLVSNGVEFVSENIGAIHQDSMGLGTIIYFPRLVKANKEE